MVLICVVRVQKCSCVELNIVRRVSQSASLAKWSSFEENSFRFIEMTPNLKVDSLKKLASGSERMPKYYELIFDICPQLG